MKHVILIVQSVCFWGFIAIKVGGTSLAAWSWWWLLMTPVPVLSLLVTKWGL